MVRTTQQDNYKYFLDNQDSLIKEYSGKFLVIKDKKVIGTYDDQVTAFTETTKDNEPESFIIQQATSDSTNTQVFHSRVLSV